MTSSGKGLNVQFTSTSDTAAIASGKILTANSSGNVSATTLPSVDLPIVGISVTQIASRTSASQKLITVQTSGIVDVAKTTTASFVEGAMCYVQATTTTVGTGSGSTCLMAASATTVAAAYNTLWRCVKAATTSDTTVQINLNLRS